MSQHGPCLEALAVAVRVICTPHCSKNARPSTVAFGGPPPPKAGRVYDLRATVLLPQNQDMLASNHPTSTHQPNTHAPPMADASPFSSLGSPRSSESFYTAKDSDAVKSTAASSPAHGSPCPYRDARRLPHELKEHCQIFLEEQLCKRRYLLGPHSGFER